MSIIVFRGGRTARWLTQERCEVDLFAQNGELHLKFEISASGPGYTHLKLDINSESFEELAKKMFAANEDAAIRAFRAAMEGRNDGQQEGTRK